MACTRCSAVRGANSSLTPSKLQEFDEKHAEITSNGRWPWQEVQPPHGRGVRSGHSGRRASYIAAHMYSSAMCGKFEKRTAQGRPLASLDDRTGGCWAQEEAVLTEQLRRDGARGRHAFTRPPVIGWRNKAGRADESVATRERHVRVTGPHAVATAAVACCPTSRRGAWWAGVVRRRGRLPMFVRRDASRRRSPVWRVLYTALLCALRPDWHSARQPRRRPPPDRPARRSPAAGPPAGRTRPRVAERHAQDSRAGPSPRGLCDERAARIGMRSVFIYERRIEY